MAISKIILNGSTLMDVTADTVTSSSLVSGYTALQSNGMSITGTYSYQQPSGSILISQNGMYNVSQYSEMEVDISDDSDLKTQYFSGSLENIPDSMLVTILKGYALADFSKISIVSFSNVSSLTSYYYAGSIFTNCVNLEEIYLENLSNAYYSMTLFSNLAKLKTVYIPLYSISSGRIAGGTFENCYALENITWNAMSTASVIGAGAFRNCSSLSIFPFPNVRTVENSAFYGCQRLSYANFSQLSIISEHAFAHCTSLSIVDLPAVTSISSYAFMDTGISEISISTPIAFGSGVFSGCKSLTNIYIASLSSIAAGMFSGCTALSKISTANFPDTTDLGLNAFEACTLLQEVDLPNITWVGQYCFNGCTQLRSVNMPNISNYMAFVFSGCTSLSAIKLLNISAIGRAVFQNCTNLSEVYFRPLSSIVTQSIFLNCYRLRSLYLLRSDAITALAISASTVFGSTPIAGYTEYTDGQYGSIFVPASLYNTYKTATNWAIYSARFVSMTDEEIEALSL